MSISNYRLKNFTKGWVPKRLNIAYGVGIIILGTIGGISVWNTANFIENSNQVERAHQLNNLLNEVNVDISNAESGQRGYLLTGEEQYLQPYYHALDNIELNLLSLQDLTSQNPIQREKLNLLRSLINTRFELFRQGISLRRTGGVSNLLHTMHLSDSKGAADDLQAVILEMTTFEQAQLEQLSEQLASAGRITINVVTLLTFSLFALAIYTVHREIDNRRRSDEQSNAMQEELETRVQERTEELNSANKALHAEVQEHARAKDALVESQKQLNLVLEAAHTGTWSWNLKTGEMIWSESLESLHGFQPGSFRGTHQAFMETVHPEDRENLAAEIARATDNAVGYAAEYRIIGADGEIRWMSSQGQTFSDENGQVEKIFGVSTDISERKRAEEALAKQAQELADSEEALRMQTQILQSVLNSMGDGVVVADARGKFLLVNPAATQITGLSQVFSTSDNWTKGYDFYMPDKVTAYPTQQLPLIRAIRGEEVNGQELFIRGHKTSQEVWVSANARPWKDADGVLKGGVAVFRDITDRKRVEQRLAYLAEYDSVTGLPNRNLFFDRFKLAMARTARTKKPIAVMFLDLDHFKSVNDTLGHDAGDSLLKQFAGRLLSSVRESDTVARLAGDEFTILMEGVTHQEDIATVAQKIIKAMDTPFKLGENNIWVTTSIGIATSIIADDNMDGLLKKADIAMYWAKKNGRNNLQFYSGEMSKQ